MGLAAKRDRINLERLAINVRDYAIKDNSGHTYDGTPYRRWSVSLEHRLASHFFQEAPHSGWLSCSNFPIMQETFVCNDLYYRSLFLPVEKMVSPDLVSICPMFPRLARFRQTVNQEGNKKTQAIALSARNPKSVK